MKKNFLIKMLTLTTTAIAALALQACQELGSGADFVPGMQDVPLMDGFKIQKDRSSIFDTKGGKIVEATAVGKQKPSQVQKFYEDTLPHLGWAEADHMVFLKEGEAIKISTEKQGSETLVTYSLSPSAQ